MIVYQVNKKDLEESDFQNVRKIKYSGDNLGDNLIIVQIPPRDNPGEERKKVIIHSPASDYNWELFRKVYFKNSTISNI